MTLRCGWVRAMCSTIGSTVVMPAPALASSSGPSDDSTTKSPAGALTSRTSPTSTWSCRNDETRPSGAPFTPRTRRTVICSRVPTAVEDTVYWRGWRSPSGQVDEHRHVLARADLRQPAAVRRFEHQRHDVGGLLDAAHHAVRAQRARRVDARLLVEPGLLGDQLRREQPVDLAPGVGDLGGDGVAEHLPDRGQQVVTDDRVLLRADPERDVLVGDPPHHVVERRARRDRSAGRRRPRPTPPAPGSARPVAWLPWLNTRSSSGMLLEHAGIEAGGDLLGVLGHHAGRRAHDGVGAGGQQLSAVRRRDRHGGRSSGRGVGRPGARQRSAGAPGTDRPGGVSASST